MRDRKSPYPSPVEPISLFRACDSQTPCSTPDVCVGSVSFLPAVGNLLSWAAAATGRGAPLAEGPGGGPALRLAGLRALALVLLFLAGGFGPLFYLLHPSATWETPAVGSGDPLPFPVEGPERAGFSQHQTEASEPPSRSARLGHACVGLTLLTSNGSGFVSLEQRVIEFSPSRLLASRWGWSDGL